MNVFVVGKANLRQCNYHSESSKQEIDCPFVTILSIFGCRGFLSCFLKVQGELRLLQNMKLAIPIFHSYGHKTQCQVLFLTSFDFFQYLLYQLKKKNTIYTIQMPTLQALQGLLCVKAFYVSSLTIYASYPPHQELLKWALFINRSDIGPCKCFLLLDFRS